jgi:LmbE family N-acetylglucosaminyl deacetylase
MAPLDVKEHLQSEIAAGDPWRLESNPFEHQRYALMLNMIRTRGPFAHGLEVGCAAGFFTGLLAGVCERLHVVDVLPEAIERAAKRLSERRNITFESASVAGDFADGQSFDLIVVSEVLCYMPDLDTLRRVVANLAGRLAPGGLLVFGSAVDATCARWGLFAGAETAMREWDAHLREADRVACQGSYWGENCLIAAYTPDADENAGVKPAREDTFVPHSAVREIPAKAVVVLAPHPDDEVLGCGGAILRHIEKGVPVRVMIATDGAALYEGEERAAMTRRRQAESRAAAAILGTGEPIFWNLADRSLTYSEALVQRVVDAIAGADLVYAPSLDELHPDHRALGMAAIEAVRRSGRQTRLAQYEISAAQRPNLLLDISDVAPRKKQAIACFTSQLDAQRYDEQIGALNRYRTYTLPSSVSDAEAYLLVSAEELQRDPLRFHWPDRQLTEAADRGLRRDLAAAQKELQALHSSTSWRITAPLRTASRIVRRFMRTA